MTDDPILPVLIRAGTSGLRCLTTAAVVTRQLHQRNPEIVAACDQVLEKIGELEAATHKLGLATVPLIERAPAGIVRPQ